MRKKKITISIGSLLLAGALAAGVCCMGYAARGDDGKWFGNGNVKTWHWSSLDKGITDTPPDDKPDDKPTTNGETGNLDFVMTEGENNGFTLLSAKLPRAAYSANGISEDAELVYVVTATLYPADAENQLVDWALVWEDDETPVTSCVTLTIPEDGSLSVTLVCTEAFPNRAIKLICTSRDSGASAYKLIRCEGIATEILVNNATAISDCRWGNTNTYAINLSNALDYVGEAQYGTLTVKSVTLHGIVEHYDKYFVPKLGTSSDVVNSGSTWHEGRTVIALSEKYPNALAASVSGHNLVLEMISYPSAKYGQASVGSQMNGSTGTMFTDYTSTPKEAYAEIVIGTDRIEKTFRVDFSVGVTGVLLGNDIII